MPRINVTLKKGADASQLEQAKKQVQEQGGKIVEEFTLVKAFTAEFPADTVNTLQTNDHVTVEDDGEVKTQ
ncbi:peptidase inhibitor i9 like protein [Zymoseptoria brevis]|uniref:Peptidase inhibitor i9 like protein n=1 Tax=Zymoseptoria brevis TaxID=1047168 RepID=A0A0F4GWL0_9PEZI|nr:peptidase inhibitor i9 like protein [Zymoseptoria brevis]